MHKIHFAFILAFFLFFSCSSSPKLKELPRFREQDVQVSLKGLNELSGICLSKDGDFLFGIDDEGGVYRINIDDNYTFSKIWDKAGQMEDIALDSKNGDIFVGLEEPYIFACKIIADKNGYDFNRVEELKSEDFVFDFNNAGLEGLTVYKDNLYIGVQKAATLFEYNSQTKKISQIRSLKSIAACDIKEIAGLDYDEENDWLWVLDSVTLKIYLFNGRADKLLASYYIGDTAKKNPEGICVDKKRRCIWICEDIRKNSILHKYNFDKLGNP